LPRQARDKTQGKLTIQTLISHSVPQADSLSEAEAAAIAAALLTNFIRFTLLTGLPSSVRKMAPCC
jgi:hypothetical protein